MKMSSIISILFLITFFGQVNRAQTILQEPIVSPRLIKLANDVKGENRSALENFWQEVTKQGAPLVEPIPNQNEFVWLTFLWHGNEETQNVVIWSDLGDWQNLDSLRMHQLPNTDVWYKTYRVRNDARFAYRLTVNDSLLPFGSEARAKQKTTFLSDPLNPRQFDFFKPAIYSMVEFPSPHRWI